MYKTERLNLKTFVADPAKPVFLTNSPSPKAPRLPLWVYPATLIGGLSGGFAAVYFAALALRAAGVSL